MVHKGSSSCFSDTKNVSQGERDGFGRIQVLALESNLPFTTPNQLRPQEPCISNISHHQAVVVSSSMGVRLLSGEERMQAYKNIEMARMAEFFLCLL